MVGQFKVVLVIQYIQIFDYALVGDVSAGKTHYLIEYGQGIAHTTVSFQCDDVQCLRFGGNTFFGSYIGQMCYGIFHTDAVEVVYLATRQDGWQYLMLFSSGKDKYGMAGRFFQCFQKSVESGSRQHVHLVNDVYLVFAYLGRDTYLFYQLPDIVYGIIGCSIQLVNIV